MEEQPFNESSSESRRRQRGRRAGRPGEAYMDLGEGVLYVDFSDVLEQFRMLSLRAFSQKSRENVAERPLEEWD